MEEKIYKLLDLIKKSGDACPDYEKIKELTPKILLNPKDIDGFLYALPECDYDISALEAVLLVVDGEVIEEWEPPKPQFSFTPTDDTPW